MRQQHLDPMYTDMVFRIIEQHANDMRQQLHVYLRISKAILVIEQPHKENASVVRQN